MGLVDRRRTGALRAQSRRVSAGDVRRKVLHAVPDETDATSGAPVVAPDPAAKYVGLSVNRQGNERALSRTEPGRIPPDSSNARFSTGVDPRDPVTSAAPFLPSGDQAG